MFADQGPAPVTPPRFLSPAESATRAATLSPPPRAGPPPRFWPPGGPAPGAVAFSPLPIDSRSSLPTRVNEGTFTSSLGGEPSQISHITAVPPLVSRNSLSPPCRCNDQRSA